MTWTYCPMSRHWFNQHPVNTNFHISHCNQRREHRT